MLIALSGTPVGSGVRSSTDSGRVRRSAGTMARVTTGLGPCSDHSFSTSHGVDARCGVGIIVPAYRSLLQGRARPEFGASTGGTQRLRVYGASRGYPICRGVRLAPPARSVSRLQRSSHSWRPSSKTALRVQDRVAFGVQVARGLVAPVSICVHRRRWGFPCCSTTRSVA